MTTPYADHTHLELIEEIRHAARLELIRLIAKQLVAEALADGQLAPQNRLHDKRSHLRPVLNGPAARNIPR